MIAILVKAIHHFQQFRSSCRLHERPLSALSESAHSIADTAKQLASSVRWHEYIIITTPMSMCEVYEEVIIKKVYKRGLGVHSAAMSRLSAVDLIFLECLRQSTLYHQSQMRFFWLKMVPLGQRKLWRGERLPPGHMCQTWGTKVLDLVPCQDIWYR